MQVCYAKDEGQESSYMCTHEKPTSRSLNQPKKPTGSNEDSCRLRTRDLFYLWWHALHAQPTATESLSFAIRLGFLDVHEYADLHGAEFNIKDVNGGTPLRRAILETGHFQPLITKIILKKTEDVNNIWQAADDGNYYTPLILAAWRDSVGMMQLLLNDCRVEIDKETE
jgi:hypothetical protein